MNDSEKALLAYDYTPEGKKMKEVLAALDQDKMTNEQLNKLYDEREEGLKTEIMDMFGFCGCGRPEVFVEQLRQYLKLVEAKSDVAASDYYAPYMYLADKAGLTEHGGSVLGAWITDKGKELLKRLDLTFFEFCQEMKGKDK